MRRLYVGYLIIVAVANAAVFVPALTMSPSDVPPSIRMLLNTLLPVVLLGSIGGGFLLFIGCLAYWCCRFVHRYARRKTPDASLPAKTLWENLFGVADAIVILSIVAVGFGTILVPVLTMNPLTASRFCRTFERIVYPGGLIGGIGVGLLLSIGCLGYWCCRFIQRIVRGKAVEDSLSVKKRWQEILGVVDVVVVLSIGAVSTCLLMLVAINTRETFARDRADRAMKDIGAIESACARLLSDACKTSFLDLFEHRPAMSRKNGGYVTVWTSVVPELLQKGFTADLPLRPKIRARLATFYLDVQNDPWGNPYQMYVAVPGLYPAAPGQNAARSGQPVYVWSMGRDEVSSISLVERESNPNWPPDPPPPDSGSDDINNWDLMWILFYGGYPWFID